MRSHTAGVHGALVVLALCACGETGSSPTPDGGIQARYAAAWQATLAEVSSRLAEYRVPGAGVAVVLDGRLAFSGGVGVRARSSGAPVTGETLFRSSSAASKTAIAVALLQLAEEGRVDLRAPLSTLVPEIQLDPRYASQINLDLALLQRAGLDCCAYRPACPGTEGVREFFRANQPIVSLAPPDTGWSYTATGAVVGAAVLEAVEGRAFTTVLRDRVLARASMTTATYDPAVAVAREHAVGHEGEREIELDAIPGAHCGEHVASTGLLASAADHGRFLELLLAPGRALRQSSLDLLQGDGHNPGFGPSWSYGYQVYGLRYKGVRVYHHYGMSEGFATGVSWIPARGFGVVILTNGAPNLRWEYVIEELRWRAADRFLGLTGAPPDDTPPPSTWGRYVGTYADPSMPGLRFIFALDPSRRLTFVIDPVRLTPRALTTGALDAPYQGGNVFSYWGDPEYFLVAFEADATGAIAAATIYSSLLPGAVGAQRVP